MSDKDKDEVPEKLDDLRQDDPNPDDSIATGTVSISPSILRPINTPRPDISNAPSVVVSLPEVEVESENLTEETAQQRLRRRMRFLEMRREHYNNMLENSEQCHMESTEDEDHKDQEDKKGPK
ncbi:uncharacterized protein LOC128263304 [Drosophila gunungcola]|uniref:Uncharacterized protein n=1 Tax=Drosophila gunungcola TaxID=103775 RepID=A0A9P9YV18_9MUSC|nr:uncharacterized protein LOC128263304 [Drosophila gunungcola]KAI8043674.1 hypothetical protein M5D96_005007 [Drosophila gunungcola]